MKLKDKIQKLMYGRYGIDDLNNFLFKLYFLLFLINIFTNSNILSTIELLLFIIIIYRIFSKKIYVRSKENQKYIKYRKKVLKPLKNIKDKEWIYKRCKHCKKLLKLPIPDSRGIKTIKCPKCKKESKVLILKKQKVEFIKK